MVLPMGKMSICMEDYLMPILLNGILVIHDLSQIIVLDLVLSWEVKDQDAVMLQLDFDLIFGYILLMTMDFTNEFNQ
jgi:hypothetical protein